MRHLHLALASLLLAALAAACADPAAPTPAGPTDDEPSVERPAQPLPTSPVIEEPPEQEQAAALADIALPNPSRHGDVYIDGSTAYYTGVITEWSAHRLFELAAQTDAPVDTLVINSPGGYTTTGRRLGQWVRDQRITVVVDEFCFSSCANYIFTAAPKKIIRDGAYVGWHGSEQYWQYVHHTGECVAPGDQVTALPEPGGYSIGPDGRMIRQEFDVIDEATLLASVGVMVDALLYGIMPERCESYLSMGAAGEAAGWTFSIDDMADFGINNVVYEGDGEYPQPPPPDRRVFVPLVVYDLGGAPPRILRAAE